MNYEEHIAKTLLQEHGLPIPRGRLASSPTQVRELAAAIGPCVVKAQVPVGGRGKAGGILLAATPDEAAAHAETILGMTIGRHQVTQVLVEEQLPITQELYVAVLNDAQSRSPLILFSAGGGMEVENIIDANPTAMRRQPIDIIKGCQSDDLAQLLAGLEANTAHTAIMEFIRTLYGIYRAVDAELLEVNPLALVTGWDKPIALDCKLTIDDSARIRQPQWVDRTSPEPHAPLEVAAAAAGLHYIELPGDVGVLANGAGLTMTTMDAVAHFGGRPANFLEIGGDAYTKGYTAIKVLLQNPRIRSLLVNFCGAFARTDVMAEGVVQAWEELTPGMPIFFSIHGTGEDEAVDLVQRRLGITPFDQMDDAVRAAVAAAAEAEQ